MTFRRRTEGWEESVLRAALGITAVAGTLRLCWFFYVTPATLRQPIGWLLLVIVVTIWTAALLTRLPISVRLAILLCALLATSTAVLATVGPASVAGLLFLFSVLLAAIYWGLRAGLAILTLSVVIYALLANAYVNGQLPMHPELAFDARDPRSWVGNIFVQTLGTTAVVAVILHLLGHSRRSAARVRESEQKFSRIFYASPEAISITHESGRFVEVNDAFTRVFGRTRDEAIGKTALEMGLWSDPAQRGRMIELLERDGAVRDFEIHAKTKQGRPMTMLFSSVPVELDGEMHFVSLAQDATERVEAQRKLREREQELLESEARLREVFDHSMDQIVVARPETGSFVIEAVNALCTEYMQRTAEELIGSQPHDLFDSETAANLLGIARRCVESKAPVTQQTALRFPVGLRHVVLTLTPIPDQRGEVRRVVAIVHDVTEARTQAGVLKEMSSAARVGGWEIDLTSSRVQWTAETYRIFGLSPDSYSPSIDDAFERLTPESRKVLRRLFERTSSTGEPYDVTAELVRPDGQRAFVRAIGRAEKHDGKVIRVYGAIQDITELRDTRSALATSEERVALLIEHAPEAIVVLDVESQRFASGNAAAERLFEVPRTELTRYSPVDLSPEFQPDGRPSNLAAREYIGRAADGKVVVFEWRHRTVKGRDIDCEVRLLRLPDPERVLLRGSVIDLSDRKRTERALRSLSQETAGVTGQAFFETSVAELARGLDVRFAQVAELVRDVEPARVRTLANWAGKAAPNISFDVAGTPLGSIGAEGFCHLESDAAAGFPNDDQLGKLGVSGYAATAIANPAGERLGFLSVFDQKPMRDTEALRLTLALAATRAAVELERLRGEAAIRALNEELESRVLERTAQLVAANQELQSFSYSVSHDLRAPLRALSGFSQALENDYRDRVDERGQDYLKRIRGASQRMGQLIDDLLRLSRTTRSEMNPEKVDLAALAREVADDMSARSLDRNVEFICKNVPLAVADPSLARIMLENLLDNAWKYTRTRDSAEVEFGSRSERDEGGAVVYYVRDNGVGFDMDHAGRLFTPFERLHPKSKFEGSGIGLATVARVAARHGGRVWVEAEPERGATFFFTLRGSGQVQPNSRPRDLAP